MEEAPANAGKAGWDAWIATTIALSTALFTAMGFLATRSYIDTLGLPNHVNIPVEGYLQHGARFFFVLGVHMLPMGLCAGILFLAGAGLAKWWKPFGRLVESPVFIYLMLGGTALLTLGLELSVLDPEPVFAPGKVRDIAGEARTRLYLIEFGVAVTLTWLAARVSRLRMARSTMVLDVLRALALLAVLVEILVLPLCFGHVAMMPDSFERVSLRRDNEPANLEGVLVYSDAEDYYLYTDRRRLTQIPHRLVKEVQFEETARLEDLAKH